MFLRGSCTVAGLGTEARVSPRRARTAERCTWQAAGRAGRKRQGTAWIIPLASITGSSRIETRLEGELRPGDGEQRAEAIKKVCIRGIRESCPATAPGGQGKHQVKVSPPQAIAAGQEPPNTDRNSSSRTICLHVSSTRSAKDSSGKESDIIGFFRRLTGG